MLKTLRAGLVLSTCYPRHPTLHSHPLPPHSISLVHHIFTIITLLTLTVITFRFFLGLLSQYHHLCLHHGHFLTYSHIFLTQRLPIQATSLSPVDSKKALEPKACRRFNKIANSTSVAAMSAAKACNTSIPCASKLMQ